MERKLLTGGVSHEGDVSTAVLTSCFSEHWDDFVMAVSIKENQELKPRRQFYSAFSVFQKAIQFQHWGMMPFNASFIWHCFPLGSTQRL